MKTIIFHCDYCGGEVKEDAITFLSCPGIGTVDEQFNHENHDICDTCLAAINETLSGRRTEVFYEKV